MQTQIREITFHGGTCVYRVMGTGDPIVLVHGFCEEGAMWDEFARKLSTDNTVIIPDLPGYGKSDLLDKEITIDLYADFIKSILEKENINSAIIIGHSMGGYIAVAFADKYPEWINKLGLFHSHPFADSPEKKKTRVKAIDYVQKNGVHSFVKNLLPNLFGSIFKKNNPLLLEHLANTAGNYNIETIVGSLKAMMNRPDKTDVLLNISSPVLFIIGKMDSSITYSMSLSQTHLPKIADIYILEDVGHMGMYEAPLVTCDIIQQFLKLKVTPLTP